jgi:spore germination protein GerM
MSKFMVKPQRCRVGLLASTMIALSFGLAGCPQDSSSPPTIVSASSPSPSVTLPTSSVPTVEPSAAQPTNPSEVRADVYWLSSSGTKLALTPAKLTLSSDRNPNAQLKAIMERLLQGPANSNVTSSIPAETKLNSLKVENDGVHVDLSKAFTSGGGSTAMQGRLGQVIYTASSLTPTTPVWISVDGEPLKVLGGEGLEVSQPMTRTEFSKNFSL